MQLINNKYNNIIKQLPPIPPRHVHVEVHFEGLQIFNYYDILEMYSPFSDEENLTISVERKLPMLSR